MTRIRGGVIALAVWSALLASCGPTQTPAPTDTAAPPPASPPAALPDDRPGERAAVPDPCAPVGPGRASSEPVACDVVTATVDAAPNQVGFYTSVAIGTDGLPVISYFDFSARALKVAHCSNPGCTAGNTLTLVDDPPNDVGLYTSVAIGTDGLPVISYFDFSAGALKVAHCGNRGCTDGNTVTVVDDSSDDAGRYNSVAIGSDGLPVISYFDFSAGTLKVAHCGNQGCTAGTTITMVDGHTGRVGPATDIAIGADGLPVISYVDLSALALKVAHCGNPACTGDNTLAVVDDPRNSLGLSTSIAIGADGLPVIAYFDATADALKVAHCTDPACLGDVTVTTVDDPENGVGSHISLAIGAEGHPVISYRDFTADALKLAHCGNATCTADNRVTVVDDPANDVGHFTSIATGADGIPVISYHDATADALKVARPPVA